jgi:hypothetical protein
MKMRRDSRTNTYTGYTAEKLAEQFEDATVKGGVVRWNSNNNVPFEDMLTDFAEAGFIPFVTVGTSLEAREVDNKAFFAEYRKAQANRSEEQIAEERFEARAAFGAGEKITNIFTGETFYS